MVTGNVELNCNELLGEGNKAVIVDRLIHDLPCFSIAVDMLTKLD